jgi:hypothetical protein
MPRNLRLIEKRSIHRGLDGGSGAFAPAIASQNENRFTVKQLSLEGLNSLCVSHNI